MRRRGAIRTRVLTMFRRAGEKTNETRDHIRMFDGFELFELFAKMLTVGNVGCLDVLLSLNFTSDS